MKKLTHKDFYASREKIEKINKKIEELLIKRFQLTNIIGEYKLQENLPVEDRNREKKILKNLNNIPYGDYIREIEKEIFVQSKLHQERLKFTSVILMGLPGCGKSAFGKKISEELGVPFVNTDNIIVQKENMPIEEIFSRKGEEYFRKLERKTVSYMTKGYIISLGGGTVLDERNISYLKEIGKFVYLKRDIDDIGNIKGRPLAKNKDDLKKLYKERSPIYEKLADFTVENNRSFDEIKKEIIKIIIKIMK